MLSLSKKRMAKLGKVPGCLCVPQTNLLRPTGDTLVTSLLRDSLAVVGSGPTDNTLNRRDACFINVMAGKVLGDKRSARIPVLHVMTRVMSSCNLYILRRTAIVGLGLRAANSSLQSRLLQWLRGVYGVPACEAETRRYMPSPPLPPHVGELKYLDFDIVESWCFQLLASPSEPPTHMKASSVYHLGA